ncbi:Ig-like domain-containing protein [Tahibacter amnicola]|uniref:Ig-like domain-containing protein n=1 Tax=Tahibacter amnicola TaxID=2976241 RepID=A0ABY6BJQ2_9GAMM|nr:Ig-like domain-containing protein [Tahibacter amnicola]UXI69826.1 Ig-like domain-containing protein [Tahibacter amnicola]
MKIATARSLVAALACLASTGALAGAFVFADETNLDLVAHAKGYTGAGASLTLNVCIDPNSNSQASMEVAIRNAIYHWNQMVPTVRNLRTGTDNQMTNSQFDWESTMMHELGHCIGLAHPNLASESMLTGTDPEYTKSSDGPNNTYNLTVGADGLKGSPDDTRGDDDNLHWYRRQSNNPFVLVPPIQGSTYSRTLGFLPAGHTFAANGERSVSTQFGVSPTEVIMQQGQGNDEDQRTLVADDVGTLMLARTGHDRIAGTSDDYTVTLQYGGVAAGCDISASIDPTFSGLAVCQLNGQFNNSTNIRITGAVMRFSATTNWHFTTTRVPAPSPDTAVVGVGASTSMVNGAATSLLANDTHPTAAALVMSTTGFPGPANGSVTLNTNGTFLYTHNGNSATSDSFTYRACVATDLNACSMGVVTITISDVIFEDGFE